MENVGLPKGDQVSDGDVRGGVDETLGVLLY
jgi:hypothetical protein